MLQHREEHWLRRLDLVDGWATITKGSIQRKEPSERPEHVMPRLCELGLAETDGDNGYRITDAGRSTLASLSDAAIGVPRERIP